MLSCVNKVFERLLGNQITTKYDDRLGGGLTAYQKHNSCETSLIDPVEDWKLLQMSKAFDSLHPPLMLCKLKAYIWIPGQSTGFAAQLLMQSLRESAHWIGN